MEKMMDGLRAALAVGLLALGQYLAWRDSKRR